MSYHDIDPTYPKTATNAYWQRKKGLLDKAKKATKVTGLGDVLKKAEAEYKKIEFNYLDVGTAKGYKDNPDFYTKPADIDLVVAKAKRHVLNVVRPARQAMRLAAVHAEEIKANKGQLYSSTTVKAATEVAAALRQREKELMKISFEDFEQEKLNLRRKLQYFVNQLNSGMTSALNRASEFINEVKETPTPATFNTSVKDAARGLTQQLGNASKALANGADLNKPDPLELFNQMSLWGNKGRTVSAKAKSEAVLDELNRFEEVFIRIRNWWN